jgi:hypothetical protein
MSDTGPQTAGGEVLWHFTMSLDGFVAGPKRYGSGWRRPAARTWKCSRRPSAVSFSNWD